MRTLFREACDRKSSLASTCRNHKRALSATNMTTTNNARTRTRATVRPSVTRSPPDDPLRRRRLRQATDERKEDRRKDRVVQRRQECDPHDEVRARLRLPEQQRNDAIEYDAGERPDRHHDDRHERG